MRRSDHLYSGFVWLSVCFERCVLPDLGLCDGLITCTEESYGCLSLLIFLYCQVEVCATG